MENVLFLTKKIFSGLLMPVPLILFLLLWALLFLLRSKTRWIGYLLFLATATLLFAASYPPLSSRLTGPLEQQFASYRQSGGPVDYVSVLGSAQVSAPGLPITSELTPPAIVRLAEGIRIYRLNPGSKLIFTGYHGRQPDSFAEKIKQLALGLGVPERDILAFTGPRDTAEEAALITAEFSGSRLVLVTSAAHMPRAMYLFRKAGLEPIPAPTNHLSKPVRSKLVFPNAATLAQTQNWVHEKLGLLWAGIVGKTKEMIPTGPINANPGAENAASTTAD